IVVFYRFVNHAATPAAAPQLASSSTRSVRTVTVTPPAAPGPLFDEGSGNAAPPTATAVVPVPAPGAPLAAAPTSVPAAVPAVPAPAPAAAAGRGGAHRQIRFGI